ncbi:alpha/beta hydrolase [Subtercola sp. YIM 133946]|uniref:alpha/beta hydrolase n=1 Tax=Subtercola sp. YIM 133946 TaxID=3118909 RepID=UPI002F9507D6
MTTTHDTVTTTTSPLISRTWPVPQGLRVRGTVVVLGGRGETPDVYNRFGNRISIDAYAVVAFADAFGNEGDVADEIRSRIASAELTAPIVVVGSDVGAVSAVDVAKELGSEIAAVIVAAYPTAGASFVAADWQEELLERTTCPVHRGVLDADAGVEHGSFAEALDADLVARDLSTLTVPVVAIHGGADLVSPLDDALATYRSNPDAQIWVIEGAKHDVLNDSTHRTTAAVVVQFLEAVRSGATESIARRVQ